MVHSSHLKHSLTAEGTPNPAMFMAATWNWYTMFSFKLLICNMTTSQRVDVDSGLFFKVVQYFIYLSSVLDTPWGDPQWALPFCNVLPLSVGKACPLLPTKRNGKGIGISVSWLLFYHTEKEEGCYRWNESLYLVNFWVHQKGKWS